MSSDSYISIENFDFEYYLLNNPDVKTAGIDTLEKCYKHWITYGCYENRLVKSIDTQREQRVKLKPHTRFITHKRLQSSVMKCEKKPGIILKFKIAIMIHIFNVKLLPFFVSYINYLNKSYASTNFDIYFNIVEENDSNVREYCDEQLKQIPNITCYYSENRGGDIGGFLILCRKIIESNVSYKYVIFVHSKTNPQWRKELCHCIFDIPFATLEKNDDIGIISDKKWIRTFDPKSKEYDYFKYHMVELCTIYELPCNQSWSFVAGTMFLANISIIRYIVGHDIDRVYSKLNRIDTVDINWMMIVGEKGLNTQGTCNDFQYRIRFHKPLLSDYMIEHTFERIIGLICQKLNLKTIGM